MKQLVTVAPGRVVKTADGHPVPKVPFNVDPTDVYWAYLIRKKDLVDPPAATAPSASSAEPAK